MFESNPYDAPLVVAASDRRRRWPMMRWLLNTTLFLSPLLWLLSCYATWGVAWLELGHRPRISIDDPKSIGSATHLAWSVSMVMFVVTPGLVPVIFVAILAGVFPVATRSDRESMWQDRSYATSGFLLLVAIAIALAKVDPGRVLDWWID